jgi:hypothetical protein
MNVDERRYRPSSFVWALVCQFNHMRHIWHVRPHSRTPATCHLSCRRYSHGHGHSGVMSSFPGVM